MVYKHGKCTCSTNKFGHSHSSGMCVAHNSSCSGTRLQEAVSIPHVGDVRRVVEHFNRSLVSGYKLMQALLNAGKEEHKVLVPEQDVQTCWTIC